MIVMGVSGAGKSTIATRLSQRLGWDFEEGDNLHSAAAVAKMTAGRPLTDSDREPWLRAIRAWIDAELDRGRCGVITCSALKRRYRDQLRRPGVRFVYLQVPEQELARRLAQRSGHFMPASLLGSQLAELEPPTADEQPVTVPAGDPDQDVERIIAALDLTPSYSTGPSSSELK